MALFHVIVMMIQVCTDKSDKYIEQIFKNQEFWDDDV